MANSIQYAKIASVPSVKVKTNELAGRVRVAFAEYEASCRTIYYQYVRSTQWSFKNCKIKTCT